MLNHTNDQPLVAIMNHQLHSLRASPRRQEATRLAMKAKERKEIKVTCRSTDMSRLAAAGKAAATTTRAIWPFEKPLKAWGAGARSILVTPTWLVVLYMVDRLVGFYNVYE